MLKGIDISHWNSGINWKKVKADGIEYAIMKCTESTSFRDGMFTQNKKNAREAGVLCGYYHFARAGNAKDEAKWFLENVGDIKEGELIALDYEIYTLSDPAKWCREWLDYIYGKVGFKPLLYTYHAMLNKYDWTEVSSGNYGLWAARYGWQQQTPNSLFKPATGSWQYYAIWQYCSKGSVDGISGNVDLNTTDMDLETLKKYGKKEKDEPSVVDCEEIEKDLAKCKKDLESEKTYSEGLEKELHKMTDEKNDYKEKLDKIKEIVS